MDQFRPIRMTMPKTYTIAGVAQELGVAESTVRRWLNEGRLKGARAPGLWAIPESEVERVRNERERESR